MKSFCGKSKAEPNKSFNKNRSCIEIVLEDNARGHNDSLIKTEVVLKLFPPLFHKHDTCLIKTEVVLKFYHISVICNRFDV